MKGVFIPQPSKLAVALLNSGDSRNLETSNTKSLETPEMSGYSEHLEKLLDIPDFSVEHTLKVSHVMCKCERPLFDFGN